MKVYDLTYEQLRNFNRCSFKRLTILLLILMNICIYIVYEIENTIVSMTKLYSSILPSTYFFSDFAQPIHFAKQERVYGIFYAYTSLLKKVLPVVCRRLMSYTCIFTPGLWWAPFRVPRPVSCVSNSASFSWLSIRLKSSFWQIKKGDPIYTVMHTSPRLVLTGIIVLWGRRVFSR
jgi:hypothetical protein